jgi:cysteine desulfurase NifS
MNALDAEERGIRSGDLVHVRTVRGQVVMRAFVTEDIVRGAVDANMGGGGPLGPKAWRECNINELTDLGNYDPISGFPVYKALLCDVARVAGGSEGEGHGKAAALDSGESGAVPEPALTGAEPGQSPRCVYLDHNATTPLAGEVREAMARSMEEGNFGNPSGIYREGREARFSVDAARRSLAQMLNCTARRVVFTGGGSEANNLAVKGVAFSSRGRKNHVVTSSVEHPSVLNACRWLERRGFRVTYLEVDGSGRVDPDDLARAINGDTCLVTVMAANNETGTLQPISELAAVARERGVVFHTDAVQAAGKIPVDPVALGVDLLSLSAHKFYGPKGVGALYVRKGVALEPLISGGGQEGGLRAGTENLTGIVGFGKAAELAVQGLSDMDRVRAMRDMLQGGVLGLFPGAKVNGHGEERLPNTLNVSLPGFRGESVVLAMDQRGVSLSSGSACRSGSPMPSHALLAMGLSEEEAHCALRFSLGAGNTVEEIEHAIAVLGGVVRDAESAMRFVPCR